MGYTGVKDMTESTVTFSAKDYKNQGLWKEITISGEEFIRRFLMHEMCIRDSSNTKENI